VGRWEIPGVRLRAWGTTALGCPAGDGPVTVVRLAMVIQFLLTDGPKAGDNRGLALGD
jgi:hypothetical protein